MRRPVTCLLPLLLVGAQAPPARPEREGLLRIATSPALAALVARAAASYGKGHPGLAVQVDARGSDIAMALLYTAQADVAVIGRAATDPEVKGYEWIYRRPPAARPVFAGSGDQPEHSPSVAVLVNAANPSRAISLDELRAIYLEPGHRSDYTRAYLPDTESGTGRFLRHALFGDATLFAWSRVRETRTAAPVARQRHAIALATGPVPAGTKMIALQMTGRAWMPGEARYPLDRTVCSYGADQDAAAAGFMDFLVSAQGQALARGSGYRPLDQLPGDAAK